MLARGFLPKANVSAPKKSTTVNRKFFGNFSAKRTFASGPDNFKYKEYNDVSFPKEHFDHYKLEGTPSYQRSYAYFVIGTAGMAGAVGVRALALDFIQSWSASADVLALANIEVDLGSINPGNEITVKWRGKPLFIRHRTEDQIQAAENVPMSELKDPQADSARTKKGKPEWLVLLGICTHLGCVPLKNSGDYGGWFCPCHGSHYDTSGRIRKGPAPLNLEIPPFKFMDDSKIIVGVGDQ